MSLKYLFLLNYFVWVDNGFSCTDIELTWTCGAVAVLAVEEKEGNARDFRVPAEYYFPIWSVKATSGSINISYLGFFSIILLCDLEVNYIPWDEEGFLWWKRKHVWCGFGNCHLYTKQHLVLSFEVALMHRNLDATMNSTRENIFHVLCVPLGLVCIEITSTVVNVMNWTGQKLYQQLCEFKVASLHFLKKQSIFRKC